MSEPFYHCILDDADPICSEDIHGWFELSYASYLTLPRSLLQEMTPEWQHRLVRLLDEMAARYRAPLEGTYAVLLRGPNGRFIPDPLRGYRHPDRAAIRASAGRP